jgi:regulator of RNase E activity RraA
MAHRTLFEFARPGDVALIVGPSGPPASLLGGEAAVVAQRAGLAACLLAGDVRDVDEIVATGLPVWCTRRTPATGRYRIEAAEINGPVDVGGIQVRAGDVAIADDSGVAFVPSDLFAEIAAAILAPG